MFQPHSTKSHHSRKPVAKMVHLETWVSEGSLDNFYSGFSGRIQDGGIFITTWQLLEKFTPVEITIHFPNGQTISPRGTVEWVREANPSISDTPPGIGISFFELKPLESDLIESWLISNPPVFLDSIAIDPPPRAAASPDDIELETLPLNLGPGCDLNAEHLFISGLARDITHYLNERPLTPIVRQISAQKSPVPRSDAAVWTLRVLPTAGNQRFQGAFQPDDPAHRLFVQTDTPVAIGTQLNLQLICETGARVGCPGEVRWIRKRNPLVSHYNAPAGMGVVLHQMKPTTWHALNPNNFQMVYCEPVR